MSEDHDSIVIARLRDTAENIHSRGPVIAAQHLRDAADRIAGQRQQIEALEAANASLATDAGLWAYVRAVVDATRRAYEQASGGKTPTVEDLVAAIHRGAR